MKKFSFLALCCFVALANAYELKKITAPPEIDGKADAIWQTAPALPLVKWRSNKGAPLMPSTVKFLYDDANLYCLAEFRENNMNEALMQSSKYPRRDAPVYENDCCELFIDPFMDGKRSFHLIADIHGTPSASLPAKAAFSASTSPAPAAAILRNARCWSMHTLSVQPKNLSA